MALFSALHARMSAFLSSMLCPQQVRTNQNTGLIRLIACVCMVIDHAGKMFFPHIPQMRMIGRLAFPLFAYGIAVGAIYTRNPLRYLSRIVLLALISQPLYAIALAHENSAMYAVSFMDNPLLSIWRFYIGSWQKPSILLSLALGLCIMLCLRRKQWALAFGVYILCSRFSSNLDYGMNGIHLMLLFYLFADHPAAALAFVSLHMLSWAHVTGTSFSTQIYALPAGLLACLPLKGNLRLPRWFVYGFYPAHLAVIAAFVKIPLLFPA